ncbi:MAG: hypothetical protein RIB64_00805, partial [Arenibacter algicola]
LYEKQKSENLSFKLIKSIRSIRLLTVCCLLGKMGVSYASVSSNTDLSSFLLHGNVTNHMSAFQQS